MSDKYREKVYDRPDGKRITHREKPSKKLGPCKFTGHDEWGDHWENDVYYGVLRRFKEGSPLGGGEYAILSITANSEDARHDWREFQQLKNMLLGDEWEAVELYPSESRVKDPSNRFYLFCFPPGVIPFGLPGGRIVLDMEEAAAPQRPFPR